MGLLFESPNHRSSVVFAPFSTYLFSVSPFSRFPSLSRTSHTFTCFFLPLSFSFEKDNSIFIFFHVLISQASSLYLKTVLLWLSFLIVRFTLSWINAFMLRSVFELSIQCSGLCHELSLSPYLQIVVAFVHSIHVSIWMRRAWEQIGIINMVYSIPASYFLSLLCELSFMFLRWYVSSNASCLGSKKMFNSRLLTL